MSVKVEISKRLVLINTIAAFVSQTLSVSVLVWLQQFLIEEVSLDEYSIYPVIMGLMLFVPLLTTTITSGLSRFVTEAYAAGDERRVTQVVSTMAPLCAGTAFLLIFIGAAVIWNIESVMTIKEDLIWDARMMLGILLAQASLGVFLMPFRLGLYVRQKFVWLYSMGMATELIRIICLFTLLFGVNPRVLWVVVATIPGTIIQLLVTLVISQRLMPSLKFKRSEFRRELVKPVLSLSGWGGLMRIATVSREMISLLILNRMCTPAQVSSFSLGAMVDNRVRRGAIGPLQPSRLVLISMHATGQEDRLRRTYMRFCRYLAWILLGAILPFIAYRREVWSLYLGSNYQELAAAGTVMMLLMLRLPFSFLMPPLAMVANARAEMRPIGIFTFVHEMCSLGLTYYLVSQHDMGAVGAAAAVLTVTVIGYPIMYWPLGLRMTNGTFSEFMQRTLRPGFLPALVAGPVWFAAHWFTPPDSWLALGAHVVLGFSVYALILFVFCLQPDERQHVAKLKAKLLGFLPGSGPA